MKIQLLWKFRYSLFLQLAFIFAAACAPVPAYHSGSNGNDLSENIGIDRSGMLNGTWTGHITPFDLSARIRDDSLSNTIEIQNDAEEDSPNQYRIFIPLVLHAGLSFEQLSVDLSEMMMNDEIFQGGDGEPVVFKAGVAEELGFPQESIALATDLTLLTNDIIHQAEINQKASRESINVDDVEIDLAKYSAASSYFDQATQFNAADQQGDDASLARTGPQLVCGTWWNPRPNPVKWLDYPSDNPERLLESWGYHRTPDWAGGGWTHPQTHAWWLCGWNTFRDHANIIGNTIVREQNYVGSVPRGEPNPEVWRSGPWPYGLWPAYVRWWHDRY